MKPQFASIDIGTNSALLLIAEPRGGILEPVLQKVATPRVGRNLAVTGIISDESFQALTAALEEFLTAIKAAGAILTGVVATQAFREASNGPELLARVSARVGCQAVILSGFDESRLGYLAVSNRHRFERLAVLDVGGGSTEVTRRGSGLSTAIGAVSLLEACGHDAKACRAKAAEDLRYPLSQWEGPVDLVVVGGTASALAMLELKLAQFDAAAIEGLRIEKRRVTATIDLLAALSDKEKAALPGMDPKRLDILMPGLCILEAFLVATGCAEFRVSDRGIRYGVQLDWIAKHPRKEFGGAKNRPDPSSSGPQPGDTRPGGK